MSISNEFFYPNTLKVNPTFSYYKRAKEFIDLQLVKDDLDLLEKTYSKLNYKLIALFDFKFKSMYYCHVRYNLHYNSSEVKCVVMLKLKNYYFLVHIENVNIRYTNKLPYLIKVLNDNNFIRTNDTKIIHKNIRRLLYILRHIKISKKIEYQFYLKKREEFYDNPVEYFSPIFR